MTLYSDLPIPRAADIAARALDIRQIAAHRNDDATVRQLDRLIDKLPFARLCWILGTLHVSSPSGHAYRVSRAGCDCLNAQRCGKRQCWHVVLHELLLDMFETDCVTLDMECVPPDSPPGDDLPDDVPPTARHIGQRLAQARAAYL